MTETDVETNTAPATEVEKDSDTAADVKAILIIFGAAVVLAMHMVSGFTFDF